jgi:hypothetical protein
MKKIIVLVALAFALVPGTAAVMIVHPSAPTLATPQVAKRTSALHPDLGCKQPYDGSERQISGLFSFVRNLLTFRSLSDHREYTGCVGSAFRPITIKSSMQPILTRFFASPPF